MPESLLDTSAGRFHLYEGGSGPALFLLHSMAASAWSWSRAIPLLERRFHVYAPDMLGHGQSERKMGVVAVEHHAAAMEQLAEALGIQRYCLGGAALGSLVAIEMACRRPKAVTGLLLFGVPAFPNRQAQIDWLANRTATFVGPDGLAAPMSERDVFARYQHRPPDLVERVNQERVQAGLWALHDLWAIGTYDVTARAQLTRSPSIVAYGGHDPFLPGRPALMRAMPTAQHLLIEEAGHYPAWDAPERTAELAGALVASSHALPSRPR